MCESGAREGDRGQKGWAVRMRGSLYELFGMKCKKKGCFFFPLNRTQRVDHIMSEYHWPELTGSHCLFFMLQCVTNPLLVSDQPWKQCNNYLLTLFRWRIICYYFRLQYVRRFCSYFYSRCWILIAVVFLHCTLHRSAISRTIPPNTVTLFSFELFNVRFVFQYVALLSLSAEPCIRYQVWIHFRNCCCCCI